MAPRLLVRRGIRELRHPRGEPAANPIPISKKTAAATEAADVVRDHGRLDVMVNNAGILRHNQLVNETLEQWQQVIPVNQTGVFLGMRAAAKAMIAAGNGGSIINISSLAGLRGTPGSLSYGASKWAVRGMTKVAARELGRYGIRVNSIHPGLIATDMTADFPEFSDDERRAERLRSTPLGRIGTSTGRQHRPVPGQRSQQLLHRAGVRG